MKQVYLNIFRCIYQIFVYETLQNILTRNLSYQRYLQNLVEKILLNPVFHAATFFQSDPLTDLLMLLRTLINSNPVLCICPNSFVFQCCAGELFVNVHYLNFGVVFTRVYHTVLMLYLACKHTFCHCLNLKPFNSLTEHVCRTSFSNLCNSNHKKVMKTEITMVHI